MQNQYNNPIINGHLPMIGKIIFKTKKLLYKNIMK